MKYYRAVLFDLDGTTLDTDLYVSLNYLHMFQRFRPGYVPHLKELVSFSGPPLEAVFREYFPEFGFEELYAEFKVFSDRYANAYSTLYPGELECLEALRAAGYRLGIVTSKRQSATESNLRHFQLDRFFEVVVSVDQTPRPKPWPDSIWQAAAALEVPPAEILYVGDSLSDYEAARAAGTAIGLARWGLKSLPDLPAEYDFASFSQIKEVLTWKKK